jgi:lysophospholipase L1-like esterase
MQRIKATTLLFVILAFLPSLGRADATTVDPSRYSAPIKVACVGDSITFGFGISGDRTTNPYPAQLANMLGAKWVVMNYGHNAATMLNSGDKPYQKQKEFQDALQFNPDVVVILLGTNDSKPENWTHKDQFLADTKGLIAQFQALPGKPLIYLAYPIAVGPAPKFGINDAGVREEQPLLDQAAHETGAIIIDLHALTDGKWDLYNPDQVHPKLAGASLIATGVFQALTGQPYAGALPPPAHP